MKQQLVTTQNSLGDIVNWLKDGYMICLYSSSKSVFFFSKETLSKIEDEKIVYLNLSNDETLLEEYEWPAYIRDAGFVEYKSVNVLPTIQDNIYSFSLHLSDFKRAPGI